MYSGCGAGHWQASLLARNVSVKAYNEHHRGVHATCNATVSNSSSSEHVHCRGARHHNTCSRCQWCCAGCGRQARCTVSAWVMQDEPEDTPRCGVLAPVVPSTQTIVAIIDRLRLTLEASTGAPTVGAVTESHVQDSATKLDSRRGDDTVAKSRPASPAFHAASRRWESDTRHNC